MLEVIALTVDDAIAAEAGGADRIELVGTMQDDGLSPSIELAEEVARSVNIPVRAMLRVGGGFDVVDMRRLRELARGYRDIVLDGVVLGFLKDGTIDVEAVRELEPYLGQYTFHRAVDHADDYRAAFDQVAQLGEGLTSVLTAGSPSGVGDGIEYLCDLAGEYSDLMLVGGGLELEHVATLREAGVKHFHVGSRVRDGGSFDGPVLPERVARWVSAVRG